MMVLWTVLLCACAVAAIRGAQVPLSATHEPTKRIAVVGTGSGGLAVLKALVELPLEMRRGWEIVAFERRDGVGGVWLPDFDPPPPPQLPESPLYPGLRTNGAHPIMTIPHFPLPPETPLLARHQDVLQYHRDIVSHFGLAPYIKLQHNVQAAQWTGDAWNITVQNTARNATEYRSFDHLIAAPGINAFPRIPEFDGQDAWLKGDSKRSIVHCMWYRDPTVFRGKTVAVLGGGPSGWDMARKIAPYAKHMYWSRDTKEENPSAPNFPPVPGVTDVERVTSLHANGSILLRDGQWLADVDTLVLATGYDRRIPFLTAGGHLPEVSATEPQPADRLTTNLRYVHPLYEHTLSLDTAYPLGALYFGGTLTYNPTGMTCYAQGLFIAYTIARPALLQTRDALYALLKRREAHIRAEGYEPARLGHVYAHGYGPFAGFWGNGSYEDLLVDSLRERSGGALAGYPGIPPQGQNYTEKWRLYALKHAVDLVNGWYEGMEREGADTWDRKWSSGLSTEADYLQEMHEVVDWYQTQKNKTQDTAGAWWFYRRGDYA